MVSSRVNISLNKINTKSKQNFKKRLLFSFVIVLYLLLSLVFFLLAQNKTKWVDAPVLNQFFGWFVLVWVSPIVFLASKEIRDIHFKQNMMALFIIVSSITILTYAPTLVYFLPLYNIVNLSANDQIFWLLMSVFICSIVILLINILYLWTQGLFNVKQIFVHNILIFLISYFLLSFLFFGLVKSWTTILILYMITALTDTFAYIVGMLFGKKKLSPFISPNKTIAGFIGGILCSTLACLIVIFIFSYIPNQYNVLGNFFGVKFKYSTDFVNVNNAYTNFPLWWVSISFILMGLAISAVLGDLSFSYIKRKYDIKDFSNLIPGHGGMLDRIDSLSFVFTAFIILISMVSFFSSTSPLI